jgi:vacuolar protein sorting-associated protein 13A/C
MEHGSVFSMLQFTETAWLLNVHEPLIWRLVEMISRLKLGRLMEEQSTAVTVDPRVHIGLLNMTDLHFKLTLLIAPAQRPRGILGFWSTLVTSLGNTNEMQVRNQAKRRLQALGEPMIELLVCTS